MAKIYIGSHVSMNGPDYFLGSVKEAISYNATTFMFYTGAPQNSVRVPLERCKINEGKELAIKNGFNLEKIIVHAPYLINLANTVKEDIFDTSKKMLKIEIQRTKAFGAKILVLHPGSHVSMGSLIGLKKIVEGLDQVLENDDSGVLIALESMAGKGSEVGKNLQELAYIISNSKFSNRLGVCLDTCHLSDAGYELANFDSLLDEFDSLIGLDKLLVIHINDSKNPIGSHKDRHENIGYGTLGYKIIKNIIDNPRLKDIPFILETPYINNKPPYKKEIEMLINNFEENWKDNF